MSQWIGPAFIGVLMLLAAVEGVRYFKAGRTAEGLPYPRRRLVRRLSIAVIFSVMVGMANNWPDGAPLLQLALLLALLAGMLLGLGLLWRDLRETSLAVVQEASRLNEQAGQALTSLLDPGSAAPAADGTEACANDSGCRQTPGRP